MAKAKPAKAKSVEQRPLDKVSESMSKTLVQQGGKFKRIGVVSGSQLKTKDGVPVYVKIIQAIDVQAKLDAEGKQKTDDRGNPATVSILKCVDLETGEVATMVAGKALCDRLKTYQGGNDRYVGLCFEITKLPQEAGKRWKDYRCHEIEAPKGEGKV